MDAAAHPGPRGRSRERGGFHVAERNPSDLPGEGNLMSHLKETEADVVFRNASPALPPRQQAPPDFRQARLFPRWARVIPVRARVAAARARLDATQAHLNTT